MAVEWQGLALLVHTCLGVRRITLILFFINIIKYLKAILEAWSGVLLA